MELVKEYATDDETIAEDEDSSLESESSRKKESCSSPPFPPLPPSPNDLKNMCRVEYCKHFAEKGKKSCEKHLQQARFYQSKHAVKANERKKKNRMERRNKFAIQDNLSQLIGAKASQLLSDAKQRAREKDIVNFDTWITHTWIVNYLIKGDCQHTLPPVRFVFDQPWSPFSPSLDRIDSSNPNYTPENTRVVCWGVNAARNNFKEEDVLVICESLARKIRHDQEVKK